MKPNLAYNHIYLSQMRKTRAHLGAENIREKKNKMEKNKKKESEREKKNQSRTAMLREDNADAWNPFARREAEDMFIFSS